MELVEDDECHPVESGISLEAPGENAVGDDLDPGYRGDPAFVTCGDADGLSDAFAEERRHSCGRGASCDPTGLEQEYAPIHPRLVQKAEGNDGCLACTRFSLKDRSTDPGEGYAELFDDAFDRKPGRGRLVDIVHGPEYGSDMVSGITKSMGLAATKCQQKSQPFRFRAPAVVSAHSVPRRIDPHCRVLAI